MFGICRDIQVNVNRDMSQERNMENMERKMTKKRTERQARRWRKKLERFRREERQIREVAPDILKSHNFHRMKEYIQHGDVTVNAHVLSVARCSIALSEYLHISCSKRELIRGALLHDYFLYDWHIPDEENPHRLHGFYHPGTALRNASKEYRLTVREKNIISRHMWPLTVVPPGCREAWIVTAADKWCSLLETLYIYKGHGAVHARLGTVHQIRDRHVKVGNS